MARRSWTDETVINEIKYIHANGESLAPTYANRNHGGVYRQAFKRFGSWKSAVELATGLDYESVRGCKKWTAGIVIDEINKRYENGKSLTAGVVVSEDKRLHDAACTHLGSWRKAVESTGYNYDTVLGEGSARRVERGFKYSEEHVINFIKDRYEKGERLSLGYMQTNFNNIIKTATARYGSWKGAIEHVGISYEDVREDAAVNRAGRLFEELFGELLTSLNMTFTKYEHDKWRPDFVLSEGHWIDAKLSEWTSSIPETIEKYEPHCDKLTIVFLRGNKTLSKKLSDKTTIINVSHYVEQLPFENRGYFYGRLSEIEQMEKTLSVKEGA